MAGVLRRGACRGPCIRRLRPARRRRVGGTRRRTRDPDEACTHLQGSRAGRLSDCGHRGLGSAGAPPIPHHFAYRVEVSLFAESQPAIWREVLGPLTHYRFITGGGCVDVLSSGETDFTVVPSGADRRQGRFRSKAMLRQADAQLCPRSALEAWSPLEPNGTSGGMTGRRRVWPSQPYTAVGGYRRGAGSSSYEDISVLPADFARSRLINPAVRVSAAARPSPSTAAVFSESVARIRVISTAPAA